MSVQFVDNPAIMILLDMLRSRRRSLLSELAEVNRQLAALAPPPTKAEREQIAYQERHRDDR